jgi:hypothetical protein
MANWVTDRPPTEADADREGNVWMRCSPNNSGQTYVRQEYVHWSYVKNGNPWKHTTPEWKPPTPKYKPRLAVGQVWRRRDGKVVRLTDCNFAHPTYSFYAEGYIYTPDGMYWESRVTSSYDLVALISEAPAPARHLPGYRGDWIAAAVAMPTAADADCDGEVLRRPEYTYTHWTQLRHEDQWRPLASQDKRPNRPL